MSKIIRAAIVAAIALSVMALPGCNAPDDAFILEQEYPQEAAMKAAHEVTDTAEPTALDAAEGDYQELTEVVCVESYDELEADAIICETTEGELFAFNGGGYSVGDALILTLNDSGTPENVLDDTIQDVSQAYQVVTI